MQQRELEDQGLDPTTAEHAARRAFGSLALAQDSVRDVWLWPWLQSAAQDLRFAVRLLIKERHSAIPPHQTMSLKTRTRATAMLGCVTRPHFVRLSPAVKTALVTIAVTDGQRLCAQSTRMIRGSCYLLKISVIARGNSSWGLSQLASKYFSQFLAQGRP